MSGWDDGSYGSGAGTPPTGPAGSGPEPPRESDDRRPWPFAPRDWTVVRRRFSHVGAGLSVMLRGLKTKTYNISAVVTVADDGGSSGRIREDLDMIAPGDLRNCLVALAEKTCWMSVADALGEGNGSVGTKLELEHTAPTPVGMTVTCESELVAVEGRKLTFKVALHDEKGPVGGGTHERFVVNDAKFAAKAEAKKG